MIGHLIIALLLATAIGVLLLAFAGVIEVVDAILNGRVSKFLSNMFKED